MSNHVLYYPLINIPPKEWFTRALLYWDTIGTIVPSDFGTDDSMATHRLTPYMSELVKLNMVKRLAPERDIHRVWQFSYDFRRMVQQLVASGQVQPLNKGAGKIHSTLRIYREKMTDTIISYLREANLAREHKDGWYLVERKTADLYMAFLASYIAKRQDVHMTPITDTVHEFSTTYHLSSQESPEQNKHAYYRAVLLKDALPAPKKGIPPQELARFKEDYGQQLIQFREYLDSVTTKIASGSTEEVQELKLEIERMRLEKEVDQLVEQLAKMHFSTIGFAGFGTIITSAALVGVEMAESIPVTIKIGLAVAGLAIALSPVFQVATQPDIDLSAPLAYAALAQDEWPEDN